MRHSKRRTRRPPALRVTERREGHKFGVHGRSELTLELMGEHKLIVADFELLMTSMQHPQANSPPDKAVLYHRLAHSLNEHFMKEERLLYPLLTRLLGPTVCVKLRNEHAEMMEIAANSNEHLSPPEESLWQLGRLLQAHIWTEENVLFWYLDVHEPPKAEERSLGQSAIRR